MLDIAVRDNPQTLLKEDLREGHWVLLQRGLTSAFARVLAIGEKTATIRIECKAFQVKRGQELIVPLTEIIPCVPPPEQCLRTGVSSPARSSRLGKGSLSY